MVSSQHGNIQDGCCQHTRAAVMRAAASINVVRQLTKTSSSSSGFVHFRKACGLLQANQLSENALVTKPSHRQRCHELHRPELLHHPFALQRFSPEKNRIADREEECWLLFFKNIDKKIHLSEFFSLFFYIKIDSIFCFF